MAQAEAGDEAEDKATLTEGAVMHKAREAQEATAKAEAAMRASQARVEGVDVDVARQVCQEVTCRVSATRSRLGTLNINSLKVVRKRRNVLRQLKSHCDVTCFQESKLDGASANDVCKDDSGSWAFNNR
jgi:hypothetical protein